MNRSIRKLLAFLLAASALAPVSARAAIVTFESPPAPPAAYAFVNQPITEAGMVYDAEAANTIIQYHFGNPGQDLEGYVYLDGGIVDFTSATSSNFTFSGLDYDAYSDLGASGGSMTITVSGFLNGALVGTDTYTRVTDLGDDFVTLDADHLSGMQLDKLTINLPAFVAPRPTGSGTYGNVATIDNVRFNEAVVVGPPAPGVPEPASWALLIGGFGLAGAALRLQRARAPAVRSA